MSTRKSELPPPLKYWVRPITRRMAQGVLYHVLDVTVPLAFTAKKWINQVPVVEPHLAGLFPIGPLSHAGIGLNHAAIELQQIKILSGFAMSWPRYDLPQRAEDPREWFSEAGLTDVSTTFGCNGINAKGRKPLRFGRPGEPELEINRGASVELCQVG
jgi:hypothetical protein